MRFVSGEECEEYLAELRNRISASRAEQGLSLVNLAKLAGVSEKTVRQLCNGKNKSSVKTAYAVCTALGIDLTLTTDKEGQEKHEDS